MAEPQVPRAERRARLREDLADRLTLVEAKVPTTGPAAGVIEAYSFADALMPVFESLLDEIDRLNEQLLEIDSALAEYADSQESGADAPDLIAMMWDRCCQLTSRAVERALEIDRLRTQHEQWHVDRTVMLDDLAVILRTLDLGDHARPQSAHEVMQGEVLPAVERLVNQRAQLRVYYLTMNARIKQLEAQLGLREVSPVAPSHLEWCNCQAVPGTAAYPGPWHPRGDARHYSCSQDSDPPRVEVDESGLLEVSPDA